MFPHIQITKRWTAHIASTGTGVLDFAAPGHVASRKRAGAIHVQDPYTGFTSTHRFVISLALILPVDWRFHQQVVFGVIYNTVTYLSHRWRHSGTVRQLYPPLPTSGRGERIRTLYNHRRLTALQLANGEALMQVPSSTACNEFRLIRPPSVGTRASTPLRHAAAPPPWNNIRGDRLAAAPPEELQLGPGTTELGPRQQARAVPIRPGQKALHFRVQRLLVPTTGRSALGSMLDHVTVAGVPLPWRRRLPKPLEGSASAGQEHFLAGPRP